MAGNITLHSGNYHFGRAVVITHIGGGNYYLPWQWQWLLKLAAGMITCIHGGNDYLHQRRELLLQRGMISKTRCKYFKVFINMSTRSMKTTSVTTCKNTSARFPSRGVQRQILVHCMHHLGGCTKKTTLTVSDSPVVRSGFGHENLRKVVFEPLVLKLLPCLNKP